jgi:LCP family protein required for cell wall assembly
MRENFAKISRLRVVVLFLLYTALLLALPLFLISIIFQLNYNPDVLALSETDYGKVFGRHIVNRDQRFADSEYKDEVNRVKNFLLLGLDSTNQEHTDVIIVVQYDPQTNKLQTIAVARDILVDIGDKTIKLNSLRSYSPYSEISTNRQVAEFFEQEWQISIDATFIINMNKLVNMIDYLGGIPVTIQRSFEDCNFPLDSDGNCPRFEKGLEVMNGQRARIFSRSRSSTDNPAEACDPARNARQIQVLVSLFQTIISRLRFYLDSGDNIQLLSLTHEIQNNIDSTLTLDELLTHIDSFSSNNSVFAFGKRRVIREGEELCPNGDPSYQLTYCDGSTPDTNDNQSVDIFKYYFEFDPNQEIDSEEIDSKETNLCSI